MLPPPYRGTAKYTMLILRVPTDPIIADYREDCLLYENTHTKTAFAGEVGYPVSILHFDRWMMRDTGDRDTGSEQL
jgi:hypothetical protein